MTDTTTTTTPDVTSDTFCALVEFLGVWGDGYLLTDIGPQLTCREAKALAGLFRALGDPEAAERALERHAAGDDEGDDHYNPNAGEES